MMDSSKKATLPFRYAWFRMLEGKKIKLPSWSGYWAWENNTIMMHCRDGSVLDIRETDNPAYTFSNVASDDWMVIDDDAMIDSEYLHETKTDTRTASHIEELENRVKELEFQIDGAERRIIRLEGENSALRFAIRCNGVSGAEVVE
ncbi:MAG: bZIP transcription factor [Lachnospiraceae bacterium]|nr:bZIP transcription factor [Lachnospiraceae bacterium]